MQPVMGWLQRALGHVQLTEWFSKVPDYLYGVEPLAYVCVDFVGAWLALVTFHAIARHMMVRPPAVFTAMATFIAGLYWIFALNPTLPYIHPYDLPAVALMQVCVWLLLREAWLPLVAVFVLAAFNRETALSVVWLLGARFATGTVTTRAARAMCALLPLVWIATRAIVLTWLVPAGGPIAIWKITENAAFLGKPWQWPALLPFIVIPPIAVVIARDGSADARAWAIATLAGGACLLPFAPMSETRAYGDLLGFAALTLVYFFQRRGWTPA
jgi:hypothetical protein